MNALRLLFVIWFAAGTPLMGLAHALAGGCDHRAEQLTEALERSSAPAVDPAHEPCARHGGAAMRPDHGRHAAGDAPVAAAVDQPDLPALTSPTAGHDTAEQTLADCCSNAHCAGNLCGTSVPPLLSSSSPRVQPAPGSANRIHDHVRSLTPGHHLQPLRPPT